MKNKADTLLERAVEICRQQTEVSFFTANDNLHMPGP